MTTPASVPEKPAKNPVTIAIRSGGYEVFWILDATMIQNQSALEGDLRTNPALGAKASTMLDVETNYIKGLTEQVWRQITAPHWAQGETSVLRAMIAYLYRTKMKQDKTIVDFGAVLQDLLTPEVPDGK